VQYVNPENTCFFNQTSVKHGWLDQPIEVVVLDLLIW